MRITKTGYGAGSRDFPAQPNVLRLMIGESESTIAATTAQETITVLESNLDDLSPQVIGYTLERLISEGALDAFGAQVHL